MGHAFPGQPLQLPVLPAGSQHQPVYAVADGGGSIGGEEGGTADLGGSQPFDFKGMGTDRGSRICLHIHRLRIAVVHGPPVQHPACSLI
ncbi:hypothetical protein D3C75_864050 [compost metagenome]